MNPAVVINVTPAKISLSTALLCTQADLDAKVKAGDIVLHHGTRDTSGRGFVVKCPSEGGPKCEVGSSHPVLLFSSGLFLLGRLAALLTHLVCLRVVCRQLVLRIELRSAGLTAQTRLLLH